MMSVSRARALADATEDCELTFVKGDVLLVNMDANVPDGYLQVEKQTGETGLVPLHGILGIEGGQAQVWHRRAGRASAVPRPRSPSPPPANIPAATSDPPDASRLVCSCERRCSPTLTAKMRASSRQRRASW